MGCELLLGGEEESETNEEMIEIVNDYFSKFSQAKREPKSTFMQGIQCFSILFRFLFELDEPLINVSDATNIFLYIRLFLSSC